MQKNKFLKLVPDLTPCIKNQLNSKWIIDLNRKAKTIKLLEENIKENLHDLGLGKEFLDITPKEKN